MPKESKKSKKSKKSKPLIFIDDDPPEPKDPVLDQPLSLEGVDDECREDDEMLLPIQSAHEMRCQVILYYCLFDQSFPPSLRRHSLIFLQRVSFQAMIWAGSLNISRTCRLHVAILPCLLAKSFQKTRLKQQSTSRMRRLNQQMDRNG